MGNYVYGFWGNNPLLYEAACLVTFLGREEFNFGTIYLVTGRKHGYRKKIK
ncbi:MAG: hypothetical protein AB1668_03945 [Nanoarchaeota archaeon]